MADYIAYRYKVNTCRTYNLLLGYHPAMLGMTLLIYLPDNSLRKVGIFLLTVLYPYVFIKSFSNFINSAPQSSCLFLHLLKRWAYVYILASISSAAFCDFVQSS